MPSFRGRGKGFAGESASQGRRAQGVDWREDTGPLWRREREARRQDREFRAAIGRATPRLIQIALVEPEAIHVPQYFLDRAIRGLTATRERVWLRRIAANMLARLDRECGGRPVLTREFYRRCKLCGRALLGAEAETRLALDREFEGHRIPCGPLCIEMQAAGNRRKRQGNAGTDCGGDVRNRQEV